MNSATTELQPSASSVSSPTAAVAMQGRDPEALHAFRQAYRADPQGLRAQMIALDPNTLRKQGVVDLAPHYLVTDGIFGEHYRININDHIGWNIFMRGYFDPTPIAIGVLMNKLRGSGCYLDVGANIGSASIALAKIGIPVVGVEASVAVASELAANVSLNSPVPYTIVNLAVTSPEHLKTQQSTSIFLPPGNIGAGSLIKNWNRSVSESKTETVRLTTLDRVIDFMQLDHIACMKMDIEGYEYEALQGLAQGLATQRFPVLFEWRTDVMRKADTPVKNITEVFPEGYRFFSVRSELHRLDGAEPRLAATIKLDPFDVALPYENVLAVSTQDFEASPRFAEMLAGGLSFYL